MREAFASEERHERNSERLNALIEGFQRAFTADGVPQQDDYEVNELVLAEPAPGEAHPLLNCRQYTDVPKILRDHSDFSESGRR